MFAGTSKTWSGSSTVSPAAVPSAFFTSTVVVT
jgi:hypothetical protein